ncbi:MAG: efflux RND transporter permease subunit [Candidatus Competibacteraceae bacterium]|nr:efflux RND transporter permease subunit [Candidatus Competibacteraceae bacterium]
MSSVPPPEPRLESPRSFSTSRPVAVLMVALATVVFGFFSYQRLPLTLMPELSYPTLTVRTEYPGAAPEEVENDVSRPIEEALGVISGLARISSISRAGVSDVVLELAWNADMSEAIQDTLEKLDLVFLPAEAERPLILRFDPSLDPVLELSLAAHGPGFEGEEGQRRVRRIAELQVRRALEPIAGVAAVRVRGGLEEEIQVLISEQQLRRTGIPIQRVIDRLRQENVNVAGGTIKEGRVEYMVRTLNEFQNLGQIEDTVVASLDGREVRVRDLARVVRAHKEREIETRTNGAESVQVDVYKEADANMVSLARRVRAALGDFDAGAYERRVAAGLPPEKPKPSRPRFGRPQDGEEETTEGLTEKLYKSEGVLLQVVADRSLFIQSSIDEVRSTAVWGGLLAVVVLFLFLRNWKSTAIIAVAIPISLIVTFAPLNLLGVSLNIMSLGGLALGVGMLVDNSIVVLESIFRCREEGDGVAAAAVRGITSGFGPGKRSAAARTAMASPMATCTKCRAAPSKLRIDDRRGTRACDGP